MPNLQRVQQEITSGRLWKAKDRLLGLFSTYPTSQEILGLLGEVLYKMGELPDAGRYWYLTEREDALAQEAFLAFEERCGANPCTMIRQLPIRRDLYKYGAAALGRLQELRDKCPEVNLKVSKTDETLIISDDYQEPSKISVWRDRILMYVFALFLGGPWLIGLFTLLIWLISLIAPSFGKDALAHWLDMLNIVKEE